MNPILWYMIKSEEWKFCDFSESCSENVTSRKLIKTRTNLFSSEQTKHAIWTALKNWAECLFKTFKFILKQKSYSWFSDGPWDSWTKFAPILHHFFARINIASVICLWKWEGQTKTAHLFELKICSKLRFEKFIYRLHFYWIHDVILLLCWEA